MRRNYGYGVKGAIFLVVCLGLAPLGMTEEPAETAAPETWANSVHGRFNMEFDGLTTGSHDDVNLSQTLELRIDPPNTDKIRVRGLLWMHEDLDSDEYSTSALRDVNDASGADVRARLLHLYVDVDDLWGDSTLCIGRQRILEGIAYNRIDGLYFTQRHAQWHWYAFAGARATIYDDAHNDHVLGGGISYSPGPATMLRLDTYYGEEHRSGSDEVYLNPVAFLFNLAFPRRVQRDLNETAVALTAWQAFTPNTTGYARYTWNNNSSDELALDLTAYCPAWDATFELMYRYQFNSVGDRVNDLSNFYRLMGSYESYSDLLLAMHKPVTEKLSLSLEAELHDSHASERDYFTAANRDYQRYAAILDVEDLAWSLDTSLALEWWNVGLGESTWAVTGEVSRTWKEVTLTLGADYERYEDRVTRYSQAPFALQQIAIAVSPFVFQGFNPLVAIFDEYVVTMHENVYAFYAEVDWDITPNQTFDTQFTYEMDDSPEAPYWRLQAGYTIQF